MSLTQFGYNIWRYQNPPMGVYEEQVHESTSRTRGARLGLGGGSCTRANPCICVPYRPEIRKMTPVWAKGVKNGEQPGPRWLGVDTTTGRRSPRRLTRRTDALSVLNRTERGLINWLPLEGFKARDLKQASGYRFINHRSTSMALPSTHAQTGHLEPGLKRADWI